MRKTIDLCDACGRDIHESHETLDHFKVGGSFMYRRAGNSANDFEQLDLCWKCKDLLVYLMENQEVMKQSFMRMSLGNRVRFLFKKPMRE